MADQDRNIWLRVGNGLGRLIDRGADIWLDPGAVRRAIVELQGVFPVTHLEVALSDAVANGGADGNWPALLRGTGRWNELLGELSQAIGDAVRAPASWGVGLPDPRIVARAAGDESERGALKAGLEIASFLRKLRESTLKFAVIQIADIEGAGIERAVSSILKNSQLYSWARAIAVSGIADASRWTGQAETILLRSAELQALESAWSKGERIAGGLDSSFWTGTSGAAPLPGRFLLYGELPADITPKAVVEAGRNLRSRMQSGGY